MKNRVVLLWICCLMISYIVLQADDLASQHLKIESQIEEMSSDEDNYLRFKFGKRHHNSEEAVVRVYGSASYSPKKSRPLASSASVVFTELTTHTDQVRLSRCGGLKIPSGRYQITYGSNFQNMGGMDDLTLWLTYTTKGELPIAIPLSVIKQRIFQAFPLLQFSSVVQNSNQFILTFAEPVTLYLNYFTHGTSQLSTFIPDSVLGVPHAFFLLVNQL